MRVYVSVFDFIVFRKNKNKNMCARVESATKNKYVVMHVQA
jgi:hypothetical protein